MVQTISIFIRTKIIIILLNYLETKKFVCESWNYAHWTQHTGGDFDLNIKFKNIFRVSHSHRTNKIWRSYYVGSAHLRIINLTPPPGVKKKKNRYFPHRIIRILTSLIRISGRLLARQNLIYPMIQKRVFPRPFLIAIHLNTIINNNLHLTMKKTCVSKYIHIYVYRFKQTKK